MSMEPDDSDQPEGAGFLRRLLAALIDLPFATIPSLVIANVILVATTSDDYSS